MYCPDCPERCSAPRSLPTIESRLMPTSLWPIVPPLTVTVLEVGRFQRLMPRANVPPVLPMVLLVRLTVEPTCTDQTLMPQVKSDAPVTPAAAFTVLLAMLI